MKATTSFDESKLARLKRRRAHSGKMWYIANSGLINPEWDRIDEWELYRLRNVPWDEVIAFCAEEVCERSRRHTGAHTVKESQQEKRKRKYLELLRRAT